MKPLTGMQVLSLAINIPGPVAAARLAQMGAGVVKIEPPGGDPLALACPAWYQALHEGQTVITLDLKTAGGQASLDGWLARSDLLLTATRPAALERLGLDWPSLSARYHRLCQVAIVGYEPPEENRVGHDLTYQAGMGLLQVAGSRWQVATGRSGPKSKIQNAKWVEEREQQPLLPKVLVADLAGAERAAMAAVGLLLARERGMGAGYVEVSLAEAARAFAEPWRRGLTAAGGLLGGGLPGYNLYAAKTGWIAVA
ncbi:MAG: CoA transferase, partial [Chloroflexota bacterium]